MVKAENARWSEADHYRWLPRYCGVGAKLKCRLHMQPRPSININYIQLDAGFLAHIAGDQSQIRTSLHHPTTHDTPVSPLTRYLKCADWLRVISKIRNRCAFGPSEVQAYLEPGAGIVYSRASNLPFCRNRTR